MWLLLLGLAVFIGIHLIPALPRKRNRLIKQFGERNFKLFYSVCALTGLILIIVGYAFARETAPILYEPPFEFSHIAMLLIAISFVLLVSARLKGYIRWYMKHPQITAVKVWAFGHLLVNGDLASVLLFGGFLGWGIFDRISLKKREQFGLVRPRDFSPSILNDIIGVVIAGVLYWAFAFYLHKWLIGVPLI